jgi:pimeloyl-ACP methyl ester carboxylesterase
MSLLQRLGLAQVAVVGMSQGVRVALRLALCRPDLVSCLVLDGAPPNCQSDRSSADGDLSMDDFRVLAQQSGLSAFRELWASHEFTRLYTQDSAAALLLAGVLARYPGRDLLDARTDESPQAVALGRISQPTLVLNGEFDSAPRRDFGRALAHELPNASHALVPRAGHLANLDNPTAYNQLLREFCRTHMHSR